MKTRFLPAGDMGGEIKALVFMIESRMYVAVDNQKTIKEVYISISL